MIDPNKLSQKVTGVILIGIGILLIAPVVPLKIVLIILGFYFVILGLRILRGDSSSPF